MPTQLSPYRQWLQLQLRLDFDSISIGFDFDSSARRPFDDLRHESAPTCERVMLRYSLNK